MSVSTISSVRNEQDGGDRVYFQATHLSGHLYARAFPGRSFDPEQMDNSSGVHGNGLFLSAPETDAEFWRFPTVSMGLAPIGAIYRAKFLK